MGKLKVSVVKVFEGILLTKKFANLLNLLIIPIKRQHSRYSFIPILTLLNSIDNLPYHNYDINICNKYICIHFNDRWKKIANLELLSIRLVWKLAKCILGGLLLFLGREGNISRCVKGVHMFSNWRRWKINSAKKKSRISNLYALKNNFKLLLKNKINGKINCKIKYPFQIFINLVKV